VGIDAMKRRQAIFLDRDGVINPLVFNPVTGVFESPHYVDDFSLAEGVVEALHRLSGHSIPLFLVSNQPSHAKGKTSLEAIIAIATKCERLLADQGVRFAESYYCYHHPDGIVPILSGSCRCRKPSPYFLQLASRDFGVDLSRSWMVGDRDTDIMCGRNAGTHTVRIFRLLVELVYASATRNLFVVWTMSCLYGPSV